MWIDSRVPDGPRLADREAALGELRAFREAGGTAVVDCQPGGCGRDGRVLAELAAASGVRVVASTGFHLERYYPDGAAPHGRDPDELEAEWRAELERGLAEAPDVRAGSVKCAWTDGGGRERALVAAGAAAAAAAGAAMVIHTERGAAVEALAELLLETPQPPGRTQVSHVDKRPDAGLHAELARAGFVLGYDAFLRPKYDPERGTWRLLGALAGEGLHANVTAGLDLVSAGDWSVGGGAGLPALPGTIAPRLRAELGEGAAAAICGANAMRVFDGAELLR